MVPRGAGRDQVPLGRRERLGMPGVATPAAKDRKALGSVATSSQRRNVSYAGRVDGLAVQRLLRRPGIPTGASFFVGHAASPRFALVFEDWNASRIKIGRAHV